MEQLKDSIENTIEMVDSTATLFYQQKNQEGLQVLEPVLSNIIDTINRIQNYQMNSDTNGFDHQIFNVVLTEAMKAIEKKDLVLFADILTYEVNDMLLEFINRL